MAGPTAAEVSQLIEEVRKQDTQIEEMERQLLESLAALQEQNPAKLKQTITELEDKLQQKLGELEVLGKTLSSKDGEIESLTQDKEKVAADKAQLAQQLKEKSDAYVTLSADKESVDKRFHDLDETHKAKLRQLKTVEKDYKDAQELNVQLQESIEKKEQDVTALYNALSASKERYAAHQETLQEIMSLTQSLSVGSSAASSSATGGAGMFAKPPKPPTTKPATPRKPSANRVGTTS